MMRAGFPRGARAWWSTRTAAVAGVVLVASSVAVLGVASPAAAAGACATPGGEGAGGTLSGVVNTYYPGTSSVAAGATTISVGAPSGAAAPIAVGDMLLVIQMQDADFDSTNTNSYGHGGAPATPASGYTALNSAGLYEYVVATSTVSGGDVSISGLGSGAGLLHSYRAAAATSTAGQRTFQVIRVPQYTTATTSSGLTALAWNGSVGGVLALDTTSALTLGGTVSVSGLGFRGGAGIQRGGGSGLASTDVATSSGAGANGTKGEGIGGTPSGTTASNGYPGGDTARGAPGNAGGGGTDGNPGANDQNSGGGGGGNGGAGGIGGNTWSSNLATGGYGGVALPATAARVFMGGGGGAGTANNFPAPAAAGANGGGIVLMRVGSVAGGGTISADGAAAYNNTQNDGGGGGGAGGTIVITTPSASLAGATLTANGGRGGDAWNTQGGAGSAHGPGGGGGGGWVFTSSPPTTSLAGGDHGITTSGNLTYGSTAGADGSSAATSPETMPGVSGGAECADLSITKTGPATIDAGGTITYTLEVDNAGPGSATGVSVEDTLPAEAAYLSASGTGWSCSEASGVVTCTRAAALAPGPADPITITVTAPAQGGSITNRATVTATSPDPDPSDNEDSATTDVGALARLSLTKTGPATVAAGARIAYTLAVSNAGPSNAVDLTVTDTLPPGVTFVSASGDDWTCTNSGDVSVTCTRAALAAGTAAPPITVRVTAPDQPATLTNWATVEATTDDPDTSDNTDSAATEVTGVADLSLAKSGPAEVSAGDRMTYVLTVTNDGPSDAANVSVTDTLPPGVTFRSASGDGWTCSPASVSVSCTRASLASGATAPAITVAVTAPAQAGSVTNHASVSSDTDDPVDDNNAATAATEVLAVATGGLPGTGGPGLGLLWAGLLLLLSGAVLRFSSYRT